MTLAPDVRALLAAIDGGHPPPPELLARLRTAVQVKRRGRPPASVEALVRGSAIERRIQTGTSRSKAIAAVAAIERNNRLELPRCSRRTADRHLDEFRHHWIPMLRQWLVLAEGLTQQSAEGIAAIASAAANLTPRVTPTIQT